MQPEKVSGIDMTLLEKFSGFNWGGAALRCEQSQIAGACPRLARVLRAAVRAELGVEVARMGLDGVTGDAQFAHSVPPSTP